MTATERRYQGQSDKILTMEDPTVYGETFELLTFKEALAAKPPILCDYKIVTMLVQRSEIRKAIQKNKFVKPDKGKWDTDIEAAMLASLIGLNKVIKKNPIKKAVSFHSSISRSIAFQKNQEIFTKAFKSYKKLETFHVSGKTPASQRSRELEEFVDSKYGLITNARCLTEGVDIPQIDCILFADPKKSTVDIVQAAGRALRPYQGKKFGYIIVPVLLDKELTTDLDKQKEAFAPILMTLRSLAADDERIVEYFRSVSEGRQPSGGAPIETELPDGIDIDAKEFIKSVELKFWSKLAKLSWRPFKEAREFVCSLKLKSQKEWYLYARGKLQVKGKPKIPDDIPRTPNLIYKDQGWINNGDWIGTGTIATFDMEFRPFKEAREFVHGLNLNGQNEWNLYARGKLKVKGKPKKPKKPDDIPKNPHLVYANEGWINLGDWLGTGTIATKDRKYWPFKKARKFIRSLSLKNSSEWKLYASGKLEVQGKPKKPAGIPSAPWHYYEDKGWISIGDWIGTGRIADNLRVYRSFKEARKFARSLKLRVGKDWQQYAKGELKVKGKPKKPDDIPSYPNKTYKDTGWVSMGDWLGTGSVADRLKVFRPFEEARAFAHSLKLRVYKDWILYAKGELKVKGKPKKPNDIPSTPEQTYKDKGWISNGDWLGTGSVAAKLKVFRPFKEARAFARSLNLKNNIEWREYIKGELKVIGKPKKPDDIPTSPDKTYKDKGWINWGDWLGTGEVSPHLKEYRSFKEARKFVRSLKLKSSGEWQQYAKGEFKVKGKPKKLKKPDDIPKAPSVVYKDKGWINWGDWLGTGRIADHLKVYRSFKEARKFARSLNLRVFKDWQLYARGELEVKGKPKKPDDIPNCPELTYKGKGWVSRGDWLGTNTTQGK